jgi:hypothetical protein
MLPAFFMLAFREAVGAWIDNETLRIESDDRIW